MGFPWVEGAGSWRLCPRLEAGNTFENPLQECPVPESALVCLQMDELQWI